MIYFTLLLCSTRTIFLQVKAIIFIMELWFVSELVWLVGRLGFGIEKKIYSSIFCILLGSFNLALT